MAASFSLRKLIDVIFNGVSVNEDVAPYTMQVTALISVYLCFVALFLIGVYVRRLKRRADLSADRQAFWIWMASALAFSIFWIAGYVIYLLVIAS